LGLVELSDEPDPTAVWVALWRALHLEVDPRPHVLVDPIGRQLVDPGEGWRERPEMAPARSTRARGSVVARGRFVEDVVTEQAGRGIEQYVVLGAGLDTFALRRPEAAAATTIFELDQPVTQVWKRRRLAELGIAVPGATVFVPVDFDADEDWWERLVGAGFDVARPAVVSSMGVVPYLGREAVVDTLRRIAELAAGSVLVMSYLVPLALVEPEELAHQEVAHRHARKLGTPFVSLFTPEEMVALVREVGFADVRSLSAADLTARYFAERTDGLRPSSSEAIVVATTA
jgi:methyltransferase (TIGR00027 family)